MNDTRERPGRSLPSKTEKIRTELGNLYLAVTFDEDDNPFEVFGWIGKTGSFGHGMIELPAGCCRFTCVVVRLSSRSSSSAAASRTWRPHRMSRTTGPSSGTRELGTRSPRCCRCIREGTSRTCRSAAVGVEDEEEADESD